MYVFITPRKHVSRDTIPDLNILEKAQSYVKQLTNSVTLFAFVRVKLIVATNILMCTVLFLARLSLHTCTKVLAPPTKLLAPPIKVLAPPTKVLAPPTKLLAPPIKVLAPPTKVLAPPTKVLAPPTKVLAPPTKVLAPPTKVLAPPTKVLAPPIKVLAPPTKVLAPPTKVLAPPPVDLHPTAVRSDVVDNPFVCSLVYIWWSKRNTVHYCEVSPVLLLYSLQYAPR